MGIYMEGLTYSFKSKTRIPIGVVIGVDQGVCICKRTKPQRKNELSQNNCKNHDGEELSNELPKKEFKCGIRRKIETIRLASWRAPDIKLCSEWPKRSPFSSDHRPWATPGSCHLQGYVPFQRKDMVCSYLIPIK